MNNLQVPQWPQFGQEEIESVQNTLKSLAWWSGPAASPSGKNVFQFQEQFKQFCESKHAFGCSSGTVALEVALRALDVGLGDEVIVPNLTFVATASCVVTVNAVPILCDIDPHTFNIDLGKLPALITERTKAIIVVHLAGIPVEMDRVLEIASKHNLKVIEDCAQAHHARYKGKIVGNWGDIGTYSFQASKTLTGGEGGGITCNNSELAARIYSLIDCGRTLEDSSAGQTYGSDYRMPEITAGILMLQMKRFPEQEKKRNENALYLYNKLNEIEGIECQKRPEGMEVAGYYSFIVRYDPSKFNNIQKDDLKKYMEQSNLKASVFTEPLHKVGMFKNKKLLKGIDYSNANWGGSKSDDRKFPGSMEAYLHSLQFPHQTFLGSKELLDHIVATFQQLKQGNIATSQ